MDFRMSEEQEAIYKTLVSFCAKELNEGLAEREAAKAFHREGWRRCAEMGVQGLPLPAVYGGGGADPLTTIIAIQAMGCGCKDNGLLHAINSHMWGCEIPIWKFGTDDQKATFLPSLVRGEMIGAQAVTEHGAGSDVSSMRATATRDGEFYVLNGSKSIVSNGPIADLIIVFAKTDKTRTFLGGMSAFIVPSSLEGVRTGRPLDKMGLRTLPLGEVSFSDCRVPATNLLGTEGAAIRIFNECMEWERSFLFACHLGTMERILNECVRYATERIQFGKPISKYQSVSQKLADMKVKLELGRLYTYYIGWLKSENKSALLESSIVKLFVSESLRTAAADAVQIFGGYGYMSEFGIEREVRDSFAATIYSGTSEIHREIISRLLGA